MVDLNGQYAGTRPTVEDVAKDMGLRNFLLGIYQKMALGLVLTGATAWAVAHTPFMLQLLYNFNGNAVTGYTPVGYVFLFAPLVLSLASSLFMRSLNAALMGLFYWLFVAIMGVSLSSVVLLYTGTSLATTFFVTAAAFGALSIAGYTTKVDMSGWRSFLIMAVVGIILASLVNVFFVHSSLMGLGISALGVLVFSALIAMKTQWLKSIYYQMQGSQRGLAAMTYYGALSLYISFVNLFLSILRLGGGSRR